MFKYLPRALAIIFFLLGWAGTLFLIWFFYISVIRPKAEEQWVQIPAPNEALIDLKVGDDGEVFAEGENGGLYQFVLSPEAAWVNAKGTETIYPGLTCHPITNDSYQSEPMPKKVKAQVSVDCSFAEQAIYQDIALLENGETWYFENTSNSYAVLGLILFLPIGAIIDAVLYGAGLFFLALDIIFAWRRKLKQNPA